MKIDIEKFQPLRKWLMDGAPEDRVEGHSFDMKYEWTVGCRSSCCMAGYVVYEAHTRGLCLHPTYYKPSELGVLPIIRVAATVLGMDRKTAMRLFYPFDSSVWCKAPITADMALKALDYYLTTGSVDWDASAGVE